MDALASAIESLPTAEAGRVIWVTHRGERKRIPVHLVVALHADQKFTRIVLSDGREYLTPAPISRLVEAFPGEWTQTHRSHAVRWSTVEAVKYRSGEAEDMLLITTSGPVPVARLRRGEIGELTGKFQRARAS